jgi:hypothetical protein
LALFELLRRPIGTPGRQADVGADGDEQIAPPDLPANFVLVAGEDARRLTALTG